MSFPPGVILHVFWLSIFLDFTKHIFPGDHQTALLQRLPSMTINIQKPLPFEVGQIYTGSDIPPPSPPGDYFRSNGNVLRMYLSTAERSGSVSRVRLAIEWLLVRVSLPAESHGTCMPLSKKLYSLLSTGSTQEYSSRHK